MGDGIFQPDAPIPDTRAQKEALLLGSGIDLENDGKTQEHGRLQKFRNNVNLATLTIFWIVVACADMAVVLEYAVLLADHERQLAVCFEPHETVDHVHASLLELARPGDVG